MSTIVMSARTEEVEPAPFVLNSLCCLCRRIRREQTMQSARWNGSSAAVPLPCRVDSCDTLDVVAAVLTARRSAAVATSAALAACARSFIEFLVYASSDATATKHATDTRASLISRRLSAMPVPLADRRASRRRSHESSHTTRSHGIASASLGTA